MRTSDRTLGCISYMSAMEAANNRLERAIERLDAAIASRAERKQALPLDSPKEAALRADLETLRGDNQRLMEALKKAEEQHAAMRTAGQTVAARLEDAVGRLRTLLQD